MNATIIGTPKEGCYICLEGIQHENRFMTLFRFDSGDYTKLATGEVAYRILGYADTHEEAMTILYPVPGDSDRALNDYIRKMLLKIHGVIPIDD